MTLLLIKNWRVFARRVGTFLCAALALSQTPALASPNLITNGSFEAIGSWTSLSCAAALERSNSPASYGIPAAPAGSFFVEVECSSLSPTTTADYIQQSVTTIPGESYIVSARAVTRLNADTGDQMIINAAGANLATVTTGSTWTNYSASFSATTATSVIRYLSNGSATGFNAPGDSVGLMLDDAQVQQLTVSPASGTTPEDTSLVFNSTAGNGFQVATNSTAATLTVSTSVLHGKLTLASTTGLTITTGSNGSGSFTFTGTAAAINTALNAGVTYSPSADYNGADTLTFTGTAGTATNTDTVPIAITPMADIVADTVTTAQNAPITYNAITGTLGASADNFENTPTAVSVTGPSHGTAVASITTLGQITYTPNPGWFGTDTFTYTVTSGGVTETATETVNVTPLAPAATISEVTTGATGTFSFTGSNGISSQNLTTVVVGTPVSGAAQALTTTGVATTISQAFNAAFASPTASCIDSNSANTGMTGTFGTLSGLTLTIPAANVIPGANIVCTFSNTKASPNLLIAKTYATGTTPVVVGQIVTYTYVITNTGNVTMSNVQAKDMHGSPAVQVPLGAGGITSETLSAPGPLGASASPDTTANDGIWTTLAPGASVTLTYTHTVTQAEIDHG